MNKMSSSCYCVVASLFFASTTCLIAQEVVTVIEEAKPKEAAAVATAPMAVPAKPAKAIGVEVPISLTFDNTPLQDVIKAFRDTTGANLITAGTNLNAIAVSMRLDNVPWKQGLDSILIPHGLEAAEQPVGSGIYIIRNKSNTIPKFTKAFKMSFARSADVAQLFKSAFDLSMPVGTGSAPLGASVNGTVSAFPSANTVIVTATQQQLDECEKILSQIDVQRPQVFIEARFVEVDSGALREMGLKWDALKTQEDGSTWGATLMPNVIDDINSKTLLGTEIRKTGTDLGLLSFESFKLTMTLFDQLEGVTIFSNPRVIIANEEQAVIDMTIKEPNLEITSQPMPTGNNQSSMQITAKLATIPGKSDLNAGEAFFSYGISMKVTPRVSPTGLITVVIEPSISTKLGTYEITTDKAAPLPKYPIIDLKRISTTFTMNDGYTAVIGGLSKTVENSVDNGIPYLRSIPYLGEYLFGWKSREKTQKEIIIFVTVGLADPATMKKDVGLPKNAVIGREFVNGERKEPGDQTKAEFLKLNLKQQPQQ